MTLIPLNKEWVFEPVIPEGEFKKKYEAALTIDSQAAASFENDNYTSMEFSSCIGTELQDYGTIISVEFIVLSEITEERAREILQTNCCTEEVRKTCFSELCKERCMGTDEWFNYWGIDMEPCQSVEESLQTLIQSAGTKYGFLYKVKQ